MNTYYVDFGPFLNYDVNEHKQLLIKKCRYNKIIKILRRNGTV